MITEQAKTKRIVQIMAVTTLAFACSTVYLAHALQLERMRTALITAPAMPGSTGRPATNTPPATDVTNTGAAGLARAGALTEAERIALTQRLDRFKDPATRAELVARSRASLSEAWKPINAFVQLSSGELDNLLDVLAEQAVRFDQNRGECQIDPGCDLKALNASIQESRRQNMANALGPSGYEKYAAYRDSIAEQVYLQDLRTHLTGDNALSDAKAEQLALALADERRQFIGLSAQQGRKVQASAQFTIQEFQGDVAPRPFGPRNKAMTTDYNEKLRKRAAQILTPAQLTEFRKLQEERLKNAAFMEAMSAVSGG